KSPARTPSLCDSASASAGAWRSVGRNVLLRRVIVRSEVIGAPPAGIRGGICLGVVADPNLGDRMAYEVPPLPYDYTALAPTIDEETMHLHHDKHHQAYVDKANDALKGPEFDGKPVEEVLAGLSSLPADKQGPFRNNG